MKNIAAVAVAVIGITAGAVGLARAGTEDGGAAATTTTTAATRPRPGGEAPGGPLRRTVHGDLVVRTRDGFENVTYDRGTVTAVAADSLTLHRPDGVDVTVKLTDETRYVGIENAAAVQEDKLAMVVSKDGTARLVGQRDPDAPPREGRPGQSGPGGRRPGGPGRTTTTTAA